MFAFLKLELMNWDLWDHVVIPLDEKVVAVAGPNGSGKTTMLDAIRVLLGARALSTTRKLGGYLRPEVSVAVIKAQVTNPLRRGHGRRPFTRRGIFEDTATLACVLESRAGAWQRTFHILPGDATLAEIREAPRGMGPEEYSRELQTAGLPRTLLKVLALEQGETHALCRRSPSQLLEYVLEMQGDKRVLDAYEAARENYGESRREHEQQEARARAAERTLELTARDAREYEELRSIEAEIEDIEARRLPSARWHVMRRQLDAMLLDLTEAQQRVDRFEQENATRIESRARLDQDIERLKDAVAERRRARVDLLKRKEAVDGQSREARLELRRLEALREKAEAAPVEDGEALRAQHRAAMLAEADAERRLSEQRAERAALEGALSGPKVRARPPYPRFALEMADALKAAGIDAACVADVLDVTDRRWQKAVESLLGRDRFTVLVEARDALKARELASRCRYPAYVATLEHGVTVDAPAGSALSVVKVQEPRIPAWILRQLADVELVSSVEAGFKKKETATITEDGYRQDRRGGVYIGVEKLYCGAAAGEAHAASQRSRLEELVGLERQAEEGRKAAVIRRIEIEKRLAGIVAREEWEERQADHAGLEAEDRRLQEEKRQRAQAVMDIINETETLAGELSDREAELARLRHEHALGDEERRRRMVRLHELVGRRRALELKLADIEPDVPPELRTESSGVLLGTPEELGARANVLRERVDGYEGCRDAGILDLLTKQQADLDEQLGLLSRRHRELREGEDELRRARASYIRVAETTVTRYRDALVALGTRAGMQVEVRTPRLTDDDEALQSAGLDVRLGFDGKRPTKVSDPKLSGGQRVLASLLLLVALTYEGEEEGGGFFILDEPFAHLSVERIDHVARFIGSTRAQFVLTTPTTHNFAVFNAARLVLTLRKKTPEMDAAPPPLYARR